MLQALGNQKVFHRQKESLLLWLLIGYDQLLQQAKVCLECDHPEHLLKIVFCEEMRFRQLKPNLIICN